MKTDIRIYFQHRTTVLPQMTQITQMPGEACPGHYMKSCLDRLTKYLRHLRHLRRVKNDYGPYAEKARLPPRLW
jgi:hypothetical protein